MIALNRSAGGATTLPGKYYTSDAIFRDEMQHIFSKRWLCAGRISQLPTPGSFFLFNIQHESIIIVKDQQNQIHAFFNLCRHRGTRLCTEMVGQFSGSVQCPYHAWTYGLDGSLIGAPNMKSVQNFDRTQYPLMPVRVALWEGFIFINLSEDAPAFEQTMGPILNWFDEWKMSDLISGHRIEYDVRANWKMIFQNYSECYHCATAHPLLARLTSFKDSQNRIEEGPMLGGSMKVTGGNSMTSDGSYCALPIPGLSAENKNLGFYLTIFPTMFLSPHPDYVLVHYLLPLAPDRTRILCEWYFHPESMAREDYKPEKAVEFWDITNRQDWNVCELSQLGVSSQAYKPGPYCDLESLLAAFDREYLKSMEHSAENTVDQNQK